MIMAGHEAQVIFTLSDTLMENTKSKEMTVQQKPQMETYTSISGRLHARRHPRVPRGRLVLPAAQETSRVCKGHAGCVISAPHAPA